MTTRVWSDRRSGRDRRSEPRRQLVIAVVEEHRRIVDRRRGSERRSTLDRRGRGRPARTQSAERPAEHVRNALQLLRNVNVLGELSPGPNEDLNTAIDRLYRAVALLEHHPRG